MQFKKYFLLFATSLMVSLSLVACNNDNGTTDEAGGSNPQAEASDEITDEDDTSDAIENAFEGKEQNRRINKVDLSKDSDTEEPLNAEQEAKLLNIIRSDKQFPDPGISDTDVPNIPAFSDGGSTSGSKTPVLFDVGDPTVFVIGTYNEGYRDDLINLVNTKRAEFGLDPLEKNPSMCLCANVRARESAYYNGHMRWNGTPFNTVASQYFIAECIAVSKTGATPTFIVDGWMESNANRRCMLSPDFKCIGASYFNCGDFVLATLAFGY